jgi:hypothetical protein
MSEISEQKALEAYPILFSERNGYDNISKDRRESYIKGYDQAMQDFLEKAEMYLKTRVYYNMHPNNITTAIQEFKNYMQDEKVKVTHWMPIPSLEGGEE